MKNILKNILMIVVAMVISICFYGTMALSSYENDANEYVIMLNSNSNKNSEVKLLESWIAGVKTKLEGDKQDNYVLILDDNQYSFSYSKLEKIELVFLAQQNGGVVDILVNNSIVKTIDLKNNQEQNYVVQVYGADALSLLANYFDTNGFDALFIISLAMIGIFYLFVRLFLRYMNKIKNNCIKIYDLILISFLFGVTGYFSITFSIIMINYYILIPIALIIIFGLISIRKTIKKNIELLFCFLAPIFAIGFAFLILPGHVPDEPSHLARTYVDSHILEEKPLDDKETWHGAYLIKNLEKFIGFYVQDVHSYNFKLYPITMLKYYEKNLEPTQLNATSHSIVNVKSLGFVPYIPNAIWLKIAREINPSVALTFYMGRIINFTVYFVLMYLAIKITPKFKKIFFVMALLPITIQEAVAYNQDCIHNALFFLLLAFLLKNIYNKNKMDYRSTIIICLISCALALCKMGYFPIIFLALLIPKSRFKNKKDQIIKICVMILPMLILFAFTFLRNNIFIIDNSELYTFNYFLSNPIKIIKLFLLTFIKTFDYMFFRGLIDGFGWSTVYHSSAIMFVLTVLYGIMFLASDGMTIRGRKKRLMFILSGSAICGAMYCAMVTYTPFGNDIINGLQPRYFIPPLLLIMIGLSNKIFKINIKNPNLLYGAMMGLSIILVFYSLIIRYYY